MFKEEIRQGLAKVEMVRLQCTLSCEQACEVTLADGLGIRAAVMQAAHRLRGQGLLGHEELVVLFNPQPFTEPFARRRFQTPAPPFVFRWQTDTFKSYEAGEELRFELLLLGAAVPRVAVYLRLLEILAAESFAQPGSFELADVGGLDDSGNYLPVWTAGDDTEAISAPVISADWWVMQREELLEPVRVRFETPARLMTKGRPLFTPGFQELLPFILRRVTSVCYAHADVMLLDDVQPVLDAGRTVTGRCRLDWEDWRPFPGAHDMELGGLVGECEWSGPGMRELAWLLALAELFQIGRGASYGAGKIVLRASLPG